MDSKLKHIEPLLVGAVGAAKLVGVGKSLFYEMASTGRLGPMPIMFNSKKMYSVIELREWVLHKCPLREQWLLIWEKKNGNGDKN